MAIRAHGLRAIEQPVERRHAGRRERVDTRIVLAEAYAIQEDEQDSRHVSDVPLRCGGLTGCAEMRSESVRCRGRQESANTGLLRSKNDRSTRSTFESRHSPELRIDPCTLFRGSSGERSRLTRPRSTSEVRLGLLTSDPKEPAMRVTLRFLLASATVLAVSASPAAGQESAAILIRPAGVFDGTSPNVHTGWVVLVQGNRIAAVGPAADVRAPAGARTIDLPGATLTPGLIEGHSHLLLHPYDETSWNDQVLRESTAERVARGVNHAKATLQAGFTTVRDLGSEGAGYADVGLKEAIAKGVIPGPRMLVAGPAIVATGSYGPKGFSPEWPVHLGAEVADGVDDIIRVTRDQIGKGADFIKVYADYRWGPNGEAMPTFTEEELTRIVSIASSSGRPVVAHAATAEGMRRAVMAGIETIEHGDGGTPEVFRLMKEHNVAFCPTLAAGDAILQYGGWRKGTDPEPERIRRKRESFRAALDSSYARVLVQGAVEFIHAKTGYDLSG
jgi:imidazolonepropionase-like amidohydrolase